MKIAGDLIEVKQSVQGEATRMGIRAEDMGHIMGLLAGAYSNKVRAIVREYSTNARDAHIEAGNPSPIEVTLPTPLSPIFTVRDYGNGLSKDEMHEVYAQYGRSTKRESNDFNGALGIGCKSALAYCSSFTVTSVKNGVKIVASVTRDETGAGSMTTLPPVQTTETSGTTVQVPVARADVHRFGIEAADFFKVWAEGTVVVDGNAPKRFEGLRLSDTLYIVDEGTSQVVMGNVAYPAPTLDSLVPGYGCLYAFVPLGAVGFPPSREALDDTKRTAATLDAIRADYAKQIEGVIQREIDKAATAAEAVKLAIKWLPYVPNKAATAYTYKGQTLPTHWSRPERPVLDPVSGQPTVRQDGSTVTYTPDLIVSSTRYGRLGSSTEQTSVRIDAWPTTVWVYNYTPAKFTAQHKHKLRKHAEQRGILTANNYRPSDTIAQYVCFPESQPNSPFIDPAMCFDWRVVKKIQLQPRARVNGVARIPGSYDLYTENGLESGVPGDKIRQDCPLFYYRGNKWAASRSADALNASYPKFTLVCLSENRVDKFRRILPAAKTATEGVREAFDKWQAKLSADQKLALHMHDNGAQRVLAMIDPERVKSDKDLQNAARVAKIDTSKLIRERNAFRYLVNIEVRGQIKGWSNPLNSYPLFSERMLHVKPDHVYAYINAGLPA